MSRKYDCKKAKVLSDCETLTFNCTNIIHQQQVYRLFQHDHALRLSPLAGDEKNNTFSVSERARGAYISEVCRPDIEFGFAQCSQKT